MTKREILEAIIASGSSCFVHCVPTRGCSLPKHLLERESIVLQFGLNLTVPVTNFGWDDVRMWATLRFMRDTGGFYDCSIPWVSIFALVGEDDKGAVWDTSMPPRLRAAMKGLPDAIAIAIPPTPPRSNVVSFADARRRLRPLAKAKGSPFGA